MDYFRSLSNIFVSDVDKVGIRAVDLSTLLRRKYSVPLTIVLTNDALEEFVNFNQLKEKGAQLLSQGNYDGFQQEVLRGRLPEKILAELSEAYDTLSVGADSGADEILENQNQPFVTVIASPDYLLGEDHSGIFQNVQGVENLANAIKYAWASLFTERAFQQRKELKRKEFFAGIIIQGMVKSSVSALGTTEEGSNVINVSTWLGFQDYHSELEKDRFEVHKENLSITSHNVNHQAHYFARNEKHQLEKRPLESRGSEQKTDDKTVLEIARLTKKMNTELKQSVKAYYTIEKGKIYLLLTERIPGSAAPAEPSTPAPEVAAEPEFPSAPEAPEEPQPPQEPTPIEEPPSSDEQDGFAKELEKAQEAIEEGPPLFDRSQEPGEEVDDSIDTSYDAEEIEETVETVEDPVQEETEESPFEETEEIQEDASPEDDDEDTEEQNEPEEEPADETEVQEAPEDFSWEDVEDHEVTSEENEDDERLEHVSMLKDMIRELDDLVKKGEENEVEHKLNEMHETVKKLKGD